MTGRQNANGILAIWHDCAIGREPEFEAWYQQEHLVERLSVQGFRLGRRYEAISANRRYFTSYVTDNAETLTSGQYIERLNHPTPLTTKIMSEVFENMSRTVCNCEVRFGNFRGSTIVTASFQQRIDPSQADTMMKDFAEDPGVACIELWVSAESKGLAVAEEERLRGGDNKINCCLAIETLRQHLAEELAERLSVRYSDAKMAHIGYFAKSDDPEWSHELDLDPAVTMPVSQAS